MSARASNPTISSTGAAGERGGASVLRTVPMSTSRVLFAAKEEGRRAVTRWLAANRSLRESYSGVPFKMKRSYAMMGSTRNSLDVGFTKLERQVGGANILGSLADTYDPLSTGSSPPIPASPVFSDLESDAGTCFSPIIPSDMPQTPVITTTLSDGEGRVDNIIRRLDYRGAREEDVMEALRLEQLLEMQRRDSSAQRPDRSGWWIPTVYSSPESSGVTTPTSDRAFGQPTTMDMCALNELVRMTECVC